MIRYIGMTLRAIFAAASAFLTGLIASLASDQAISDLDTVTWCVIILGTLTAFGGVYGLTNKT